MTTLTLDTAIDIAKNAERLIGSRSFEDLSAECRKPLLAHAYRITRNTEQANDLVQDTLIKAMQKFEDYDPSRSFLNWTLRILTNVYLDSRRKGWNRKAGSMCSFQDLANEDDTVDEIEFTDEKTDIHADLETHERLVALKKCIARLPDQYREALELSAEGLSYEEIADLQKTTIGTVRSRLHRGKESLRAMLAAEGV